MKISNNALNFLLAQYRAIFKRAYVKGIASAVLLTAGLAAGQAQAADPVYTVGLEEGNNFYFQYSGSGTWAEASNGASGAYVADDGIIAGALGGNGVKETTSGTLTPEQGVTIVIGGDLVIDGEGGNNGSLKYVSSGTVAGGWANASGGNIAAQGNKVTITGEGYVEKAGATAGSRGVVFGGYATATSGTASVLENKIFVQDRNDNGLNKAAAHGLIGGRATGHTGAVANSNEVHVIGTDATKRQTLNLAYDFDVLGGHATSTGADATGAYTANQNIIDLQHVSATDAGASGSGLTIAGARLTPSGNAAFTVGATGNQVSITDLAVTTASGSTDVNVFGAWTPYEVSGGMVAMRDNTITIADTSISKHEDFTGVVRIVGAAVQANKSATVSLTGNKVTLTDSINEQDKAAVNTIYSEILAGAQFESKRDSDAKLNATVTGNSVEVGAGVVLSTDTTKGYITGADIIVSGDKIAAVTADNNSVSIAGDVTGAVYATRLFNSSNGTIGTDAKLSFLNNDVTLKNGGKVQSGSIVGGAGKDSAITIENGSTYIANDGTQDIASDVINIAGTIQVDASNTLDISGFYKDGIEPSDPSTADYHDNLTTIASTAVIKNANVINLYGKAVVEQGAVLTGTGADSKIVVDASKGVDPDDSLLKDNADQQVAGAAQGTLAIFKDTLKSYLNADKIGSATTVDSDCSVELTSCCVIELRDTTNIDLAKEFNFTDKTGTAGAIVLDGRGLDLANHSGSVIRGNDLTISQKLAENAVATTENDPYATTYEGLSGAETKGLQIEANTLTLGSSNLESWQSEEIKFGKAIFRDQLTFSALNDNSSGSTGHESTLNDGYHLVSEVVGDHYSELKEQGVSLSDPKIHTYYEAQDGVIEGDVTITATSVATADSGELVIRNGNFTADDEITIASGGKLTVGLADFDDDGKDTIGNHPNAHTLNAPDATLVLGQALNFDLSKGSAEVNVDGSYNGRYDAEAAAETVGDDRYVMLDLRNGITLVGDGANKDDLKGAANIKVTSGGEVLLTASNLNSLLAQNNATKDDGTAKVATTSGSFFNASHGGAFVVEGDVDATFTDFQPNGSTHGITLKDKGYLVADSLTIDNSGVAGINESKEETAELLASGTVNWGDGTVVVQDLEISNLQLTHGTKPEGASSYASQVTLAQGTAKIGSSLRSYNQTLKLGNTTDDTSGNLIFFTSDQGAEGTISVDKIQVDNGFVAAANGTWNGEKTDLTLSGSGSFLAVGDSNDAGQAWRDEDELYKAELKLNSITMSGENNKVNVYSDGSLFAHSLSMAASSNLTVAPYGYAEFDQVDFSKLSAATAENTPVSVSGHLKINGDTAAASHNGVLFGAADSIHINKNGT